MQNWQKTSFIFLNIKGLNHFLDSVLCLYRTSKLNYRFILHFAFSILHLIQRYGLISPIGDEDVLRSDEINDILILGSGLVFVVS